MEWQPIESAPKNGTTVLLFDSGSTPLQEVRCQTINTHVAIWQSDLEYDDGGAWMRWDDEGFQIINLVNPTHWMPLPPTPQKQGE